MVSTSATFNPHDKGRGKWGSDRFWGLSNDFLVNSEPYDGSESRKTSREHSLRHTPRSFKGGCRIIPDNDDLNSDRKKYTPKAGKDYGKHTII